MRTSPALLLLLFAIATSCEASSDKATQEEAAAAEKIVAKCGRIQPSLRDKCVVETLDQFSPDVMHRAQYFADVSMREADRKRNDAACKKAGLDQGSVRLGMTQAQVKQCGWGEPGDVNRTTDRHGVREQWVYGDGNYLYFHNGRLTTIQN